MEEDSMKPLTHSIWTPPTHKKTEESMAQSYLKDDDVAKPVAANDVVVTDEDLKTFDVNETLEEEKKGLLGQAPEIIPFKVVPEKVNIPGTKQFDREDLKARDLDIQYDTIVPIQEKYPSEKVTKPTPFGQGVWDVLNTHDSGKNVFTKEASDTEPNTSFANAHGSFEYTGDLQTEKI